MVQKYYIQINTLRPRQNGCKFSDYIFECIFLNESMKILIKISVKLVPNGPINNIPALVQIMAWHRPGNKPLPEPMMVSLLMHIFITWPQWVNKGMVEHKSELKLENKQTKDMSVYCVYLEKIKILVILLCSDLDCVDKLSCGIVDIKNYNVGVFITCENWKWTEILGCHHS